MSRQDIDLDMCRSRQRRLLAAMERRGVDLVIVTQIAHVQWLTGVRSPWIFEPAAALATDGTCLLVVANREPSLAAADEIRTYAAQLHSTIRNDQRRVSAAAVRQWMDARTKPRRIGVEFSSFGPHLAFGYEGNLIDMEPDLYRLRRAKDADELVKIRRAIAGTGAMYERAREIVAPGVNELVVFNELQSVAVASFGEMLTGTGNDYACGVPGGSPRDRACQGGELYILDLGPAYRGYFADNCRAIAVDREPTDEQMKAWQAIANVFPYIERTVKPGVRCKAVFEEVQAMLDQCDLGKFDHHLGHGIGLFPHEAPHLNPNWDDAFEVGDVFTVEPGLYDERLRGGIRLENDYLVTATGVELLSDFPLGLV